MNWGRRRAAVAVVGEKLLLIQTGLFGSNHREWHRDQLAGIRTDASTVAISGHGPVVELQIYPRSGGKFGLLAGHAEVDLEWMAAVLRGALRPRSTLQDHEMATIITRERPDTPDATALITELEAHLASRYAAESRHGFSVARLLAEDVAFFVLRDDGLPACCGGVLLVGRAYGEIKRMYVRPRYRGRGFGAAMLDHLAEYARAHGLALLRLETGIYQREAIGLYERAGFQRISPFGPYTDDPVSVCYEKALG